VERAAQVAWTVQAVVACARNMSERLGWLAAEDQTTG
jgi:hypothetical protein